MQVETENLAALRNGPYSASWGSYDSSLGQDGDSLPEKILSMVSKLVDEDTSDLDINRSPVSFQPTQTMGGFYNSMGPWSQALSPLPDNAKDLVYAGLAQNVLDFNLFSDSIDNLKGAGENLDSGFASPADKTGFLGGVHGHGLPSSEDLGLSWDWSKIGTTSMDPDANQNYANLLNQNQGLFDQLVCADASIEGLLNDTAGLLQLEMQRSPPTTDLLSSAMFPPTTANDAPPMLSNPMFHNATSTDSGLGLIPRGMYSKAVNGNESTNEALLSSAMFQTSNAVNNDPVPPMLSSGIFGNSEPSMDDVRGGLMFPGSGASSPGPPGFSPYHPPPDHHYANANGPLGYNNNNDYRGMFPEEPQPDWRGMKPPPPYGNGLVPFVNGVENGRPLPRFNNFRSPPPFLPRLPLYPNMDVPCFPRHPLFSFPAPLYNLRHIRRNPTRDELSVRLDQCYEQFRQLEKERKKTEAELARHNPGKKLSSANSITVPRLPPNPTRVDRLVVDQLREHARVVTLVTKMERLRGDAMGADVHSTLAAWEDAIRKVQALRQEEVRCRSRLSLDPTDIRMQQEDKGVQALAGSIHELSLASRRARTAMWASLTVTLLHPAAN